MDNKVYIINQLYNEVVKKYVAMSSKQFHFLEELVKEFLERLISTLNSRDLRRLLIFWTAADCLLGNSLKVSFNGIDGLQLRPTANTCSSQLHLSRNYQSFLEFRLNILAHILSDEAEIFDSV